MTPKERIMATLNRQPVDRSPIDNTFGKGGGYLCCSCNNTQSGTPVENILTMINTVKNNK